MIAPHIFTCGEADVRARKWLQTAERLRPAQYLYNDVTDSAQIPSTDGVRVANWGAVRRFQLNTFIPQVIEILCCRRGSAASFQVEVPPRISIRPDSRFIRRFLLPDGSNETRSCNFARAPHFFQLKPLRLYSTEEKERLPIPPPPPQSSHSAESRHARLALGAQANLNAWVLKLTRLRLAVRVFR